MTGRRLTKTPRYHMNRALLMVERNIAATKKTILLAEQQLIKLHAAQAAIRDVVPGVNGSTQERRSPKPGTTAIQRQEILESAAGRWKVTVEEMIGPSRYGACVEARREAATQLRVLGLSFPDIGKVLGGRNHTTIMSSLGALGRSEAVQ